MKAGQAVVIGGKRYTITSDAPPSGWWAMTESGAFVRLLDSPARLAPEFAEASK
jgi:hypothetical protein